MVGCFSASKRFRCTNNFKKQKKSGSLVYFNMKNILKRKLLLRIVTSKRARYH